jgi:hemerythrin-like domain-containing protein
LSWLFRIATGGKLADMRDEGDMPVTTDAIELLRCDHDELRRLLSALETGPVLAHGGPTHGGLIAQLVMAASGHEAIEEQYFWPLVRRRVQNGPRLADQAISQEQDAKRLLDLLEKHGPDEALLHQVIAISRAHIDFEETQVWPWVQLALSEQELGDLGDQLEQAKRLAPTRPHPHMPCTPEVLKVAAPIAGAADRIRDTLAGRG